MIRKRLFGSPKVDKQGFRMRSREPSRLEGFSDAVFGFALTLLVVSQQVPQTFDELQRAMRGFFPFAACFVTLYRLWYSQHIFFRRYDLNDSYTAFLNGILLFVVLFYVYPLKFLATVIWDSVTGHSVIIRLPDGTEKPAIELSQLPLLYMIYFAGFATVGLVFALLYLHAYRHREKLELNGLEKFETWIDIFNNLFLVLVGALSVGLMMFAGTPRFKAAILLYLALVAVLLVFLRRSMLRRKKRWISLETVEPANAPLSHEEIN